MTKSREIDERIAKCEKILSANPGSQIFAALAEAHRKKGDLNRAFDVCQKGLKSHPKYGSAHVVMAKINIDKGLYDWADSEIEKASKFGANSHAVETLRCEILVSKGDTKQAAVRIEKQLKVDPQNAHLQRLLKRALAPKPLATFPGEVEPGVNKRISPTPDPFLNSGPSATSNVNVGTAPRRAVSADPLRDSQAEAAQSARREQLSIEGVFDAVFATEGVYAGFLLGPDGSVLDSRWDGIGDEDGHAVFASTTADQCRDALERMPLGQWDVVIVDTPRLALYLVANGDERLAFFAGEGANRNRLRVAVSRAFEQYQGRKIEQGV